MSDPTQTTDLWAWAVTEKKRVDDFVKWWEQGQATDGFKSFPDDLPEGEWDEQYRGWSGG